MLFKNAHIYRLTTDMEVTAAELEERLSARAFVPCSGFHRSSFGWIPALSESDSLVHEVDGCFLLTARREDKVVPGSALQEALEERLVTIQSREGRKLSAKERANLKDDTLADLLPRALTRAKQVQGYLSPKDKLLVIGTGVASEAELFQGCLRDSLGSLPVVPPPIGANPTDLFTRWLLQRKLPDDFSLGDQCDLVDLEEGSSVTCRRLDLGSREIQIHMESGKICNRIGLRWHQDFRFTIDKDLVIRQIKTDVKDDNIEADEDPIGRLDAALAEMTLEFRRFLPALFSALGGESRL